MFLDLALQYRQLESVYPLPTSITRFGPPQPPSEYWVTVLHTAVLRKFIVDHVAVRAVAAAVLRRLRPEAPAALRKAIESIMATGAAESIVQGIGMHVGETRVTAYDIARIELYGRHLHADWGKWQTSHEHPTLLQLPGVYDWCTWAAEHVRVLVVDIRIAIRGGLLDVARDLTGYDRDDSWAPMSPDV